MGVLDTPVDISYSDALFVSLPEATTMNLSGMGYQPMSTILG